ncbi:hypothetical protein [Gemmata palustris]|nr:hypothetical protein [Gemmata palustris]
MTRTHNTDNGRSNPALHLTPPADSERTAYPVVAVPVSYLFGNG